MLHSIQKVYPPNLPLRIHGQCTDRGGGGTKHALYRALQSRHFVMEHYLTSTCSLHNIQKYLQNVVVNVLEEGGMNEKNEPVSNVMKMLHVVYNLQNWQKNEELKQLWIYLQDNTHNEKFRKLEETIMTRWCLVGVYAVSFYELVTTWRNIFQTIHNSALSGSASL